MVAILGTYGFGTLAAATFPIFIIGLLWKGASSKGVMLGMLTALISTVAGVTIEILKRFDLSSFSWPGGVPWYVFVLAASVGRHHLRLAAHTGRRSRPARRDGDGSVDVSPGNPLQPREPVPSATIRPGARRCLPTGTVRPRARQRATFPLPLRRVWREHHVGLRGINRYLGPRFVQAGATHVVKFECPHHVDEAGGIQRPRTGQGNLVQHGIGPERVLQGIPRMPGFVGSARNRTQPPRHRRGRSTLSSRRACVIPSSGGLVAS